MDKWLSLESASSVQSPYNSFVPPLIEPYREATLPRMLCHLLATMSLFLKPWGSFRPKTFSSMPGPCPERSRTRLLTPCGVAPSWPHLVTHAAGRTVQVRMLTADPAMILEALKDSPVVELKVRATTRVGGSAKWVMLL